jgi:hypothetical protein
MFSQSLVVLALAAAPALATVFVTSPVASTTFHGGQPATISWQDNGTPPLLQDFGNAKVSIYAGNAQQQTSLQLIVPSVNVATTSSIQFTPEANIGPNSNEYFIRIESLGAKDPLNPQFPALSFSAKFTLDNMSGTFTPDVQAEIDGQSTAPLAAGQTTPPTPAASGPASASSTGGPSLTTSRVSSAASSASSKAPSASATASKSAALGLEAGWVGILLSAIVGVVAL